jgi:hypothetical protein
MNNFLNINIWFWVKWIYLFTLGLYIVFAIVMVRQVCLMTQALNEKISAVLRVISWFHLILAAIVFLLALFVL